MKKALAILLIGLMLLAALADYRRGRSGAGLAETKAAQSESGERT